MYIYGKIKYLKKEETSNAMVQVISTKLLNKDYKGYIKGIIY